MDPLAYWIGFNRVRGIGPARLRTLLDAFGSIEAAWTVPGQRLQEMGLDRRSLANLLQARKELDLEQELQRIRAAGIQVLTWDDPRYPERLMAIPDPPPVLYVRGSLLPQDDFAVALVGTRSASVYGRQAARQLTGDLVAAGVTIVSGLALGIDAEVHRAALEAGGRTLAVLGSGVDVIYPWEHRRLAQEIVDHGAVISEYALGTKPDASNFPPRNRIVSGLSRGVVVVEAGERSGALITARYAAEQGRDVFAVPGSIFTRSSQGTNSLIRQGAQPALTGLDILQALGIGQLIQHVEARQALPVTGTEAQLLACLSSDPQHVDDVSRTTGLPIAVVTSTLTLLELKGLVRQVGNMQFVRI